MSGRHDFSYAGQDYRVEWSPLPGDEWKLTIINSKDENFGSWVVDKHVTGTQTKQVLEFLARVIADFAMKGVHPLLVK